MVNKQKDLKKEKGFRLYIEGTRDGTNGDLRKGFHQLLAQACKGNMPRIVMGDDRKSTIDKFLTDPDKGSERLLLVDSDAFDTSETFRKEQIAQFKLQGKAVFFMIQEIEAWFLSQPATLDSYFKYQVSEKIPQKDMREVDNPSDKLAELTRHASHRYHKVRDGATLLEKLDMEELKDSFNDVENLVAALNT